MSPKLTPAAWTATRAVPGRKGGAAIVSTTRLSGSPNALHSTARICASLQQRRRRPHPADDAAGDILDRRAQQPVEFFPLGIGEDAEALEDAAHRDLGGAAGAVLDLQRDTITEPGEGAAEDALCARLDARLG